MFNQLRHHRIFKTPYAVGIHLHHTESGEREFRAVLLKAEKGKVILLQEFSRLDELFTAASKFTKDYSFHLCISGKGLIEKRISFYDDPTLIQLANVFPGATEKDFDHTLQATVQEHEWVLHLARKEMTHKALEYLASPEFNIVSLSLGDSALCYLANTLNPGEISEWTYKQQRYQFVQQQLISKTLDDTPEELIEIGNKKIDASYSLACAAALQYLSLPLALQQQCNESIRDNFFNKNNDQVFRKSLLYFVLSFTVLFFINFFINYVLSKEVDRLNQNMNKNAGLFSQLQQLKTEIDKKQQFLQDNGLLSESRLAFYADETAATLPEGFLLDRMQFNPSVKSNKIEDEFKFKNNLMLISGSCKNPELLASWIERLKDFPWTNKVFLLSFQQEKEHLRGQFIIELNIQ